MYDGDMYRDASNTIRGFLFQDFVTIMCLLQDNVECVCSEFLEDVDVFYEDGTFEFIQVKYYPKTSPDMKEISTDLYYQFLRLQMLHSTLKAKPRLIIHRATQIKKTTLDDLKKYIGLGAALPMETEYLCEKSSENYLKNSVYTLKAKEKQKEKIFSDMASEKSMREFINQFDISHRLNISKYKFEVMDKLFQVYSCPDKNGNENHWKLILFGLAVTYIQRRYMLKFSHFEQMRVEKKDFDHYMKESIQTKTEQIIVNYLVGVTCEEYGDIVNNNELSELQKHMLNQIYQNTVQWINEIANTLDGQFQLMNTFSMDDVSEVSRYREKSLDARIIKFAECKQGYIVFLDYMWKIILNLCQEKVKDEKQFSINLNLFQPNYYMNPLVKEYVCFNFPDDRNVGHCIILPGVGGKFSGAIRKIIGRMIKLSSKPEKWFFENSKINCGRNYYDYSTANIIENPTVIDLGEASFYIECMDCIGIGDSEWNKIEECSNCIFSLKCVKEVKRF